MPFYRKLGTLPPKRHTVLRNESGFRGEGLYYEEVVTTAGFGRAYGIAYHLRPPTRVRKVESAGRCEECGWCRDHCRCYRPVTCADRVPRTLRM